MNNLSLKEGDNVIITNVKLPKGTYAKIQPVEEEFAKLDNPKTIIEKALANYACLTMNETISVSHEKAVYHFRIAECRPEPIVGITDSDIIIDLINSSGEPLVNKASTINAKSLSMAKDSFRDEVRKEGLVACPVCSKMLEDPICLLPCLHNICKKCHVSLKTSSKKCPVCKNHFTQAKANLSFKMIMNKLLEEEETPIKKREQDKEENKETNTKKSKKHKKKKCEDENSKQEETTPTIKETSQDKDKLYSETYKDEIQIKEKKVKRVIKDKSKKQQESIELTPGEIEFSKLRKTLDKYMNFLKENEEKANRKCAGCKTQEKIKKVKTYKYTYIGQTAFDSDKEKREAFIKHLDEHKTSISELWSTLKRTAIEESAEFQIFGNSITIKEDNAYFCSSCMNQVWFQMLERYAKKT